MSQEEQINYFPCSTTELTYILQLKQLNLSLIKLVPVVYPLLCLLIDDFFPNRAILDCPLMDCLHNCTIMGLLLKMFKN